MGCFSMAELLRRMERIDLIAETREIVADNTKQLADANREQLMEGLDTAGKKMAVYKNKYYANRKYQLNSRPGRGIRDQKLSGKTHDEITVKAETEGAVFGSTAETAKYVIEREKANGSEVFGLTPDSKTEFRKTTLRPGLLRAIIRKTRGA